MHPVYKRSLFVLLLLMIAVAGFLGYRSYNRKLQNLENVVPRQRVTAENLTYQYEHDEEKANRLFLGVVIQVTGRVAEISYKPGVYCNIMIGNTDDLHRVSCMLDTNQFEKIANYAVGSIITIKGYCTGYLVDVELNRCIIVSNEN
jgi:hypothetical protein